MSDAAALLAQIAVAGGTVRARGDRLQVRGRLPPALERELVAQRATVIAVLTPMAGQTVNPEPDVKAMPSPPEHPATAAGDCSICKTPDPWWVGAAVVTCGVCSPASRWADAEQVAELLGLAERADWPRVVVSYRLTLEGRRAWTSWSGRLHERGAWWLTDVLRRMERVP